jgi:hypothetical protein
MDPVSYNIVYTIFVSYQESISLPMSKRERSMLKIMKMYCIFASFVCFGAELPVKKLKKETGSTMVQPLLDNKAINDCDHVGRTALIRAVMDNDQYLVQSLLKQKACVDIIDKFNCDALIYAFTSHVVQPLALDLLNDPAIKHVINRKIEYQSGYVTSYLKTMLKRCRIWAPDLNTIIERLLELGAEVNPPELRTAVLYADSYDRLLPKCSYETIINVAHRNYLSEALLSFAQQDAHNNLASILSLDLRNIVGEYLGLPLQHRSTQK